MLSEIFEMALERMVCPRMLSFSQFVLQTVKRTFESSHNLGLMGAPKPPVDIIYDHVYLLSTSFLLFHDTTVTIS